MFQKRTAMVTIGMPVLNGQDVISKAIDSIRSQSYQRWKLVVSDNQSDDETANLVRRYAEQDARVELQCQPRRLLAIENYATLTRDVTTPYFVFLAADDFWCPEFLSKTLAVLESNRNAIAVCGKVMLGDHVSTATNSIRGDSSVRRIRHYLKNPGDNSRFYSLFRSGVIETIFRRLPPRFIYAYDWFLMAWSLNFGEHVEVSNATLFRHETKLIRYQGQLDRDEKNIFCRYLPLIRFASTMFRTMPMATFLCSKEILILNYRAWRLRRSLSGGGA